MTAEHLDLSPAAILNRAADVIERNGLALKEFYEYAEEQDPRDCKVCAMGAIAVAAGLKPDGWDDWDDEGSPAEAAAAEASDLLAAHLGWIPDYESALAIVGAWNDRVADVAVVAVELRAAAAAQSDTGEAESRG
ncbi:hypothetical protein ACIBCT_20815 [Streptosporangium sp. NPDC050855]|uniref:DUF6197 family protein n=1 Tax=Streptosporangium sp. NPDC050855 TaxID=3366194 RepID=UPI00379B9B5B